MAADLFDDDRDAEQLLRHVAAWDANVNAHITEHREHLIAIATARLTGVNSAAAEEALHQHLDCYGPADVPLLLDMLGRALWRGGRSVEREARTRLIQLRDKDPLEEIERLNGGSS